VSSSTCRLTVTPEIAFTSCRESRFTSASAITDKGEFACSIAV
jgi:hypothetical protein